MFTNSEAVSETRPPLNADASEATGAVVGRKRKKTPEQRVASKRRRDRARWRVIERVVAALEDVVHMSGNVEVDVRLPELDSGKLRQFDVVIRTGVKERETLTVVEVQDRGTKLGYEKLGALYEKAMAVGASHLICVSTAGFVGDAITRARKYGPRVRLLLLSELEHSMSPLNLATGHMYVYAYGDEHFDLEVELDPAYKPQALGIMADVSGLTIHDKVLERNGSPTLLSASDVYAEARKNHPFGSPTAGKRTERHAQRYRPGRDERLFIVRNGLRARVQEMILKAKAEVEVIPIPITTFEYKPVDADEATAWVALARGAIEGAPFSAQLVYGALGDGRLAIRAFEILEIPESMKSEMEFFLRPLTDEEIQVD